MILINFLTDFFTNPVLMSAGVSWFIAQAAKVIIESVKYGFDKHILGRSGGMPSSHSATFTGLTFSCLLLYSAHSTEFAISLMLAIVVIYDSMNLRMETGKLGAAMNKLHERDKNAGLEQVSDGKFEEKAGHTLPEVIAGICIGIIVSSILTLLVFN
ncbi:MAG: divergent PAP2 family protein [Eubacteriales bacterium]|nr:divergent PAP2 family protein [Eubacteriales bacterium]